MNNTLDSRFRVRYILIAMIAATIPCYCAGLALTRISGGPPVYPTSTPLWMQPATMTITPSPTATLFFITPVFTLPATVTPTPTLLPSPTAGITPSATTTLAPTNTFPAPPTNTLQPTDIIIPTPTETPTPIFQPTDTIISPTRGT